MKFILYKIGNWINLNLLLSYFKKRTSSLFSFPLSKKDNNFISAR